MRYFQVLVLLLLFFSCKSDKKEPYIVESGPETVPLSYAKGFSIEKFATGITLIKINSPWPGAKTGFTYALVPKTKSALLTLDRDAYDAIVMVPVERIVVTSTTHIPALEALEVLDRLVGFPDTEYISSEKARQRIDDGLIMDLGNNEAINTEMVIALDPDLVIGFGIDNRNTAYETLQRSHIPVVYNGDWTEESPLGKAEWIKFFAPYFQLEEKAAPIFQSIASSYEEAKLLAQKAAKRPTILSGALYKDVWYLPGGKSWAAQFLSDANAEYLWQDNMETGSLSLSIESVLGTGKKADFWISPSQFTSYNSLASANRHYLQFKAFKNRTIFTFARSLGPTGGLLYYELAPQRPDLVLRDLIHIFHPEVLPGHQPFFFKPLE